MAEDAPAAAANWADESDEEAPPAEEGVDAPASEDDPVTDLRVGSWADESDDEPFDEEADALERAAEAAAAEKEMWSGPHAAGATLEDYHEAVARQYYGQEEEDSSEEESEEEEEEETALDLGLVMPEVKPVEVVKQLSKKEQKRLEDEAFELELAAAITDVVVDAPAAADTAKSAAAADTAPAADAPPMDAAAAAIAKLEASDAAAAAAKKKAKTKKKTKKGGGGGEKEAASGAAVAPDESPAGAEAAAAAAKVKMADKIAKIAASKAEKKKVSNAAAKIADKKRKAAAKLKNHNQAVSGAGVRFSKDNGVGGDGRGG